MYLDSTGMSCGIIELTSIGMSDPQEIVSVAANEQPTAFFLYSDKVGQAGQELTEYIRRYKLGSVKVSSPRVNPNSRNTIEVYMWEPNYDAIKKHAIKYKLEYDEDSYYWDEGY